MRTRVAGVLLAAGDGSRLGRPKALVEIAGQSLAERGVALLRGGGAEPVVVVTGAARVRLDDALVVHNPEWHSGMGSSLVTGLTALPQTASAAVIALADQPL
ncbi:MAG TPA: NTP transferase domain-containing protein, partial [Pseudonocardiaceae bacterium]|nr:NTP transferase domain-containing protein [Pseudonocardiaceae bacterium]